MQVLIVHSDAELGKELMQMVKDYTEHDCDLCPNSAKADAWARRHRHCDFFTHATGCQRDRWIHARWNFQRNFSKVADRFFPWQEIMIEAGLRRKQRKVTAQG